MFRFGGIDICFICFLFFFFPELNLLSDLIRASMGIHNLGKLIAEQAPGAIKEGEIKNYFGRKIAIDA